MGAYGLGFPATPPTFDNGQGGFNWPGFLVSQENLVANTYLANQAITSPRPSSISVAPNGTFTAAGGGAGFGVGQQGLGWGALFSNPLFLLLIILAAVVLFKK